MHTIGRFAPSPSGRMHLGNVLCALLAWLSARQQNGEFLLRGEELDEMRCPRSFADLIIDDLRWLGLDWDGEIPYQSERTAVYEKYEAILREKGLLYPCFCSRAALHAASAPHLSDGRVVYAGTCRDLTPEQVAEKRRKRAPATRVRVPERTITFTDGVYGEYTETLTEECGDFIIRRSDGVFAYQLADAEEKEMFLSELGLHESGLDRLIKVCYDLLGLMSYLTAGEQEVRAWTIEKGTKAPQAAGKIHTDFERGFIRAEVINYKDLIELGSLAAAREKGLVRSEGKEYVMQDGDVVLFRFNV